MIEALDDFIQKSSHNETLGDRNWNTARAQIEKLVFVDLTGSRAVGATDVVGENFETRHRIGFCVVTQQKVANLLIRIGEMGMRLYSDQSTENRAGAIVEGVFVQEIARGVRRDVVLQRARIEFLLVLVDGGLGQLVADQEQMRKCGIVFTIQPTESLDW